MSNPRAWRRLLGPFVKYAIAGLALVLVFRRTSLHDRIWFIRDNRLVSGRLVGTASSPHHLKVVDDTGTNCTIPWDDTACAPERDSVSLSPDGSTAQLVGIDLIQSPENRFVVARLYIIQGGRGRWVNPAELSEPYVISAPRARIEPG